MLAVAYVFYMCVKSYFVINYSKMVQMSVEKYIKNCSGWNASLVNTCPSMTSLAENNPTPSYHQIQHFPHQR